MKPILSAAVAAALQQQQAVVALESTVIAHGLPAPDNLETARACEAAVHASGALPATIAIVEGDCVVGLDEAGLQALADRRDVAKVNLSNFASIVAAGRWGATTVAATLHIAAAAGIRVFATGGIGGVHRGASESFDLSADLTALARYPVITVCAGAKAILDLPKTLEALETLGVPVVGYGTDELPAFYSRSSSLPLDLRADSPAEVARLARTHWSLGFTTGLLVVAPVPTEAEVPAGAIADVIEAALDGAARRKLSGKAITPFLLSQIAERTHGASLAANMALLRNNARIAGEIACSLGPHASCVRADAEEG
jgi:pseudouridine-5'-phosphate glycosidase